MIGTSRESIRLTHTLARFVEQCEVEPREIEQPASLASVELLSDAEVLKVLVVGPNLDWVPSALEIVLPFFQSPDDCQHLGVVNLVVLLNWAQGLGQESDRMPLTIVVLLQEHHTSGDSRAISFQSVRSVSIEQNEDGGGGDEILELGEGILLGRAPDKLDILESEVKQRTHVVREV